MAQGMVISLKMKDFIPEMGDRASKSDFLGGCL
jgi:hypothetical protein